MPGNKELYKHVLRPPCY